MSTKTKTAAEMWAKYRELLPDTLRAKVESVSLEGAVRVTAREVAREEIEAAREVDAVTAELAEAHVGTIELTWEERTEEPRPAQLRVTEEAVAAGLERYLSNSLNISDEDEVRTILEAALPHLTSALAPQTPTEPTPEPEGVRVVGWISRGMAQGAYARSEIVRVPELDRREVPVILQSDHEEIVQRLEQRVDAVDKAAQGQAMNAQHHHDRAEEALARAEKAERERDEYGQEMERLQRITTPSLAEAVYGDEADPPVAHVRRVDSAWSLKLSQHGEEVMREYDALYRSVAVRRMEGKITRLKAHIAQLSDPANWRVDWEHPQFGRAIPALHYTGPENPPESEGGDHGE